MIAVVYSAPVRPLNGRPQPVPTLTWWTVKDDGQLDLPVAMATVNAAARWWTAGVSAHEVSLAALEIRGHVLHGDPPTHLARATHVLPGTAPDEPALAALPTVRTSAA